MLQKTVSAFAIVLVLGSTALSANALARAGDFGGASGFEGVRRDHLALGRSGGNGRVSDLRGKFHTYGRPDVWGHWGNYYGPLVHAP